MVLARSFFISLEIFLYSSICFSVICSTQIKVQSEIHDVYWKFYWWHWKTTTVLQLNMASKKNL